MAKAHRTLRHQIDEAVKQQRRRVGLKIDMLVAMAESLKSGRMGVDKVSITDDTQPGLRALVRNTGAISFHAHYEFGDSRPMLKVGEWPGTTIEEARELTKTVRALAAKGIDVQEGLYPRLIRELTERGEKWRP